MYFMYSVGEHVKHGVFSVVSGTHRALMLIVGVEGTAGVAVII